MKITSTPCYKAHYKRLLLHNTSLNRNKKLKKLIFFVQSYFILYWTLNGTFHSTPPFHRYSIGVRMSLSLTWNFRYSTSLLQTHSSWLMALVSILILLYTCLWLLPLHTHTYTHENCFYKWILCFVVCQQIVIYLPYTNAFMCK